jgi:hypothetical protein
MGYAVPVEFATARHGGRTDVNTERPGRPPRIPA